MAPSLYQRSEVRVLTQRTRRAQRAQRRRPITTIRDGLHGARVTSHWFAESHESQVTSHQSRLFGVDADVIDEHLLGKNCRAVRRAGPIAAHGNIQNNKERMIKHPGPAGGPLGLRESSVQIRVYVKAHYAGLPLDGVEMKIIGEVLARREAKNRGGIAGWAGRAGPVKRPMDGAGLLANIFHDVDFAALGPADDRDVVPQHPESGPHSLPRGNFDARFKAAVGLAEKSLRFEPCGSVV